MNAETGFMDAEIWIHTLLVIAGVCTIVSAGMVIVGAVFLLRAHQFLRRVRRGPEVVRDCNGRPFRERI